MDGIYFHGTCSHLIKPESFVEDAVFSQMYVCDLVTKNQMSVSVWNYVCVFSLIPLTNMPDFLPVPYCLYYYISVEIWVIGI